MCGMKFWVSESDIVYMGGGARIGKSYLRGEGGTLGVLFVVKEVKSEHETDREGRWCSCDVCV